MLIAPVNNAGGYRSTAAASWLWRGCCCQLGTAQHSPCTSQPFVLLSPSCGQSSPGRRCSHARGLCIPRREGRGERLERIHRPRAAALAQPGLTPGAPRHCPASAPCFGPCQESFLVPVTPGWPCWPWGCFQPGFVSSGVGQARDSPPVGMWCHCLVSAALVTKRTPSVLAVPQPPGPSTLRH